MPYDTVGDGSLSARSSTGRVGDLALRGLLGRCGRLPALVAVEREEDQPRHVEAGEHRGDERDDPEPVVVVEERACVMISSFEKKPDSGGRPTIASQATTMPKRGVGQELPEPAHDPHVLVVVVPVDHRAGAEEQAALVEGVADHHEHGGAVRVDADGEEHVAELADRGVREHAFDVGLHDRDRCRRGAR